MSGMNNVLQFRPRAEHHFPGAGKPTIVTESAASPDAAQELLSGLSVMFHAAGCPGLAEAFVEAGGRCG